MKKPYFLLFLLLFFTSTLKAQQNFVHVKDGHFYLKNQAYQYLGANYWYGGLLALKGKPGKKRLKKELRFLKKHGVNNLRVMVGAEGVSDDAYKVSNKDVLQPEQNVFRDSVLYGLDYFLNELHKRKMKAVLHFTNTWEWSGGLGQYLEWNGYGKQVLPHDSDYNWDNYRDYITQFYNCQSCQQALDNYIRHILSRTNSISKIKYINEPAIMAWEIINEPRPMRSRNNDAFLQWINHTAQLIKGIDKNHLLTTGSEGMIATDNDMSLYTQMHADKNIDYLTLHLWPKNWGWFKDTAIQKAFDTINVKAKSYINEHEKIARQLHKPLVIEEFGLPRDRQSFSPDATTQSRNRFYQLIFSIAQNSDVIDGINFWAYGGLARPVPGQVYWKEGDDYMGDPGGEEQGLNSVFNTDKSTWSIIKKFAKELNH